MGPEAYYRRYYGGYYGYPYRGYYGYAINTSQYLAILISPFGAFEPTILPSAILKFLFFLKSIFLENWYEKTHIWTKIKFFDKGIRATSSVQLSAFDIQSLTIVILSETVKPK